LPNKCNGILLEEIVNVEDVIMKNLLKHSHALSLVSSSILVVGAKSSRSVEKFMQILYFFAVLDGKHFELCSSKNLLTDRPHGNRPSLAQIAVGRLNTT
jgi:hypothetical protein